MDTRNNQQYLTTRLDDGQPATLALPVPNLAPPGFERIEQLGNRLCAMMDPDTILSNLMPTLGETLQVPHLALYLRHLDTDSEELVATYPTSNGSLLAAALPKYIEPAPCKSSFYRHGSQLYINVSYRDEALGHLLIDTGDIQRLLPDATAHFVHQFMRQVGPALHIVRILHDLRRAREHLVLAREEERRLLRRNLHDTIGPTLAALNLRSGSILRLIPVQPIEATQQMAEMRGQIREVITDIRRVIYNLRPPALDELGLLPAIREQSRQFSFDGVEVRVESPAQLPPLNAAVEVAAYRIVCEALANVVRHAHAQHCWVSVNADDQVFYIEVRDDGIGLPGQQVAGVGMNSMRERAAELGGTCVIELIPGQGTRVRARLPIRLDVLQPSADFAA